MSNLATVKGIYLGKLKELGRPVDEDVVIRYSFGKDEYHSESENNQLLSKRACEVCIKNIVLNDKTFMDSLKDSDDVEYEFMFKLEVSDRMGKLATEVNLGIANKKHFILEVIK